MTTELLAAGLFFAMALVALIIPARRARTVVVAGASASASLLALLVAMTILRHGGHLVLRTNSVLPFVGFNISIDSLGALFVALTAGVAVAVSLFLGAYAKDALQSRGALGLYVLFLVSLLLVPMAGAVGTFMIAWELMAVSSTLLILVDQRRNEASSSAAVWYAAMTQVGASAILLGFLLSARHSTLTFSSIAANSHALSPTTSSLVFLLTLLGFSSKAGAVPFHVWLPKAHPQAPSPVSALMSSVMVAMGVYGIVRVGDVLLHGGVTWWWIVVSALGVVSALFGALHAATSSDLKRLLAFSTIDVIGLILIAIGCSGIMARNGDFADARLTLFGALFLVIAHGVFKASLFLVAGIVERATGVRNLDELGGLIHQMPWTSLLFGVGALAIVGVPAFSGFSSEWVVLEGLVHALAAHAIVTRIAALSGVATLALTGGLTAVAFTKAFGIGFLGRPRSLPAERPVPVPWVLQGAVSVLAVLTVVFGMAPGLAVGMISRALTVALRPGANIFASGVNLQLARATGEVEPLILAGAGLLVALALLGLLTWRGSTTRETAAWRGGGSHPTPRMQYTSTSFGEPLERVFADVLRPEMDVEVTHEVESRFYASPRVARSSTDDVIESSGYRPLIRAVRALGRRGRKLQNGNIHRYLAFGFFALLVLLVVLA